LISKAISNIFQKNKAIKILFYLALLVIETFIELLDYLIPKDDRIIIFGSNCGEYSSGSPKALYKYLRNKASDYILYYYLPFKKEKGFFAQIRYFIKFIPIFFRAKILISSHPPSDFFPFISWSVKKIFINTWHGIPMKRMFFTDKHISKIELIRIINLNRRTSAFIVSSRLEGLLIRLCFRIDPAKIFCTGHPRNDILLRKHNVHLLPILLPKLPTYQKVILYCPTYRRNKQVRFFPFDDFDLSHFEKFLEDNKMIVLLRRHPYSKEVINLSSTRIVPFDFDTCNDVNDILPEVDILITDYSSIYFDYLLLDRPCIFIPYDLNDYEKDVGFLFDYHTITAGPKVSTYKDLITTIKECMELKDPYSDMRSKLKMIFHECQKENSSEQVFILMNDLLRRGRK